MDHRNQMLKKKGGGGGGGGGDDGGEIEFADVDRRALREAPVKNGHFCQILALESNIIEICRELF